MEKTGEKIQDYSKKVDYKNINSSKFSIPKISLILWKKNYLSSKITQKFTKKARNVDIGISREIFDCLKREQDIKILIPAKKKYGLQVYRRLKQWRVYTSQHVCVRAPSVNAYVWHGSIILHAPTEEGPCPKCFDLQ